MEKIDLSIVIVTYNHEKYIIEAIESVLKQKCDFNYEIIFADDHSKDSTTKVIKDYCEKIKDKRITYLFSNENKGNSYNTINAFKHCKGKYIIGLEGDDYWLSDKKIQTQYDFLEKNQDYIAVSDKRFTIDTNKNKLESYPIFLKKDMDASLKDFISGKSFSWIETMFKNVFKDNIIDAEIIEIILKDRMIVDLPLSLWFLKNGKVYLLAQDNAVYRTITAGNNNYNATLKLMKIARNHIEILNRLNNYFDIDLSYLYAYHFLEAKIGLVLERNYKEYKKIREIIPNKHFINFKMIRFFPLFFRNFLNICKSKRKI